MTQGRNFFDDREDAGLPFDLYRDRLALLREQTPLPGPLDPSGEAPGAEAVDDPATSEFEPGAASSTHPESDLADSAGGSRPFAPSGPGFSVASGGLGSIRPGDLKFGHFFV